MNNIIDHLQNKIINLNQIYEYPNDPDFHRLKIPIEDYPSAKDGNFFNILRVFVIRGSTSLTTLVNIHTDGHHPHESIYQIIYRLLNGSANGHNISLQQRELIKKTDRSFELTPFGVLYAIHVFHMDGYYDKEHTVFTEIDDFSYQKNINGIFDIIKKHHNYFPLFFDNLDYIKESKELDINIFFSILDANAAFHGYSLYNFHKFSQENFSLELEKIIPFVFYNSAALANFIRTKKPFKFTDSINSEMSEMYSGMLKNMLGDFELYKNMMMALFN